MELSQEIRGLAETQANLEKVAAELTGPPMVTGMRDATLVVERDAKVNAPVDSGRLRASITPEVVMMGTTVQGVVGSNVTYAPYQELGTRPHWPPLAAVARWAEIHGTTAYVVARAIAAHGTRAVRYLQRAFEDNIDRIHKIIGDVVSRITTQ